MGDAHPTTLGGSLRGKLFGQDDLLDHGLEGVVLVFDEVMSGFRVALGGAQERLGVTPDMTCLGKIVGGGLPVGAYGGRREIMEKVAELTGVLTEALDT